MRFRGPREPSLIQLAWRQSILRLTAALSVLYHVDLSYSMREVVSSVTVHIACRPPPDRTLVNKLPHSLGVALTTFVILSIVSFHRLSRFFILAFGSALSLLTYLESGSRRNCTVSRTPDSLGDPFTLGLCETSWITHVGSEVNRSTVASGLLQDWTTCSMASHRASQAGPSRRSHTKSRKGCKTCKRRHIRCDETFPQWWVTTFSTLLTVD